MSETLDAFYRSQLEEWPLARENHEALTRVWSRELTSDKVKMSLRVQYNPARMVSTGAKIDKASIATRPCFLCAKNRPAEQRGLDLNEDFEWLVNPFPILPHHFTIASKEHRPQRILDGYDAMIQAVQALPEGYIVFYNGPKCGASAPDHLHLQAGKWDMPLPMGDAYRVYHLPHAESSDAFRMLYDTLPVMDDEDEPRMNVVAYRTGEHVSLIVIPRRAHRPHCYSAEGDGKYLISPGTLDMCGLIITPRLEDYERLTSAKALDILCEVGVRTEPTIDVGIMQGQEIRFEIEAPSTPPEGGACRHLGEVYNDSAKRSTRSRTDAFISRQPPEGGACRHLGEVSNDSAKIRQLTLPAATYRAFLKESNGTHHIVIKGEDAEYTIEDSMLMLTAMPESSPSGGRRDMKASVATSADLSASRSLACEPFEGASTFSLHGVTIGKEFHWQQQETQTFQGSLILRIIDGELHAINRIPIEDYLTSVIASEMSGTSSVELLKAHAIISRSWLLAQMGASPLPLPRRGDADIAGTHPKSLPSIEKYKTAHPDIYALLKEYAMNQKRYPTEAEKRLWGRLRAKKLGVRFRRQHIIGDFIVDFICLPLNIIIEIDGDYHNNPKQQEADKIRDKILTEAGYRTLRFTNEEVIDNIEDVISHIISAMSESPLLGRGRGEAIRWYDREAHTHFDVCADDHCQRYQGVSRKMTPQVREAIRATRGIVLSYEGEVCDARFSKCCGGITELYESCWDDTPHPYLSVVHDPFCNTNDPKILSEVLNHYDQSTDFYRWTVEYTQAELSELVRRKGGFDYGDILDLIPIERGPSGRIVRLQIVGTKATRIIGKELEIRRTLSETHLYSSAFEVEKRGSLTNPSFILHGRGWGHGVGLCQIGAAVMGAQGYDYKEILHHYYPEAALVEWYA